MFEDHVRLRGEDVETLIAGLEGGDLEPLRAGLSAILTFAQQNPTSANKSWPTLLKSQSFFDNVSSFRKGQLSAARATRTEVGG